MSSLRTVKYGIPQGSLLGAILFIIHISDLCSGELTTFADSMVLTG